MTNEYDPNEVTRFLKAYQDRGMMKWQGFYLSDHTSMLSKIAKQEQAVRQRRHATQMTETAIMSVINQAIQKQQRVRIDRSNRDLEGHLLPVVEGLIKGYYQQHLVIDKVYMPITEIYAIQLLA